MKKLIITIAAFFAFILSNAQNVGIGTTTPTSKLNVNGQITIDQKNFGGYGGLLLKGDVPGNNYPNIAFTVKNNAATPVDEVAAMIQGDLQNNIAGEEAIDLTFLNSSAGLGGLSEKMRIKANGNVGIGLNPTYKLHLGNAANGLRIEGPATAGGTALSIGGTGDILFDKPGIIGGRLTIKENGNIGIGNNNPNTQLSFAPSLGKKITLYPGTTGDVGFGVAGNRLQIYSDNPNADVAIGYDAAGTFNERFTVKPNGALALQGNTGLPGQILTSKGGGSGATWLYPIAHSAFSSNEGFIEIPANNTNQIVLPALTRNITIPAGQNARLLVSVNANYFSGGCGSGCYGVLNIYLDGILFTFHNFDLDIFRTALGHISVANEAMDVGPGLHTIEFKVSNSSGASSWIVAPKSSTVIALPQ